MYFVVSVTIRRKDRSPVSFSELADFDEAFRGMIWLEIVEDPHITDNGLYIGAAGVFRDGVDKDVYHEYAMKYPQLQIEAIEEPEDNLSGVTSCRYLFEGDVSEECYEERRYQEPELIDWEYGMD